MIILIIISMWMLFFLSMCGGVLLKCLPTCHGICTIGCMGSVEYSDFPWVSMRPPIESESTISTTYFGFWFLIIILYVDCALVMRSYHWVHGECVILWFPWVNMHSLIESESTMSTYAQSPWMVKCSKCVFLVYIIFIPFGYCSHIFCVITHLLGFTCWILNAWASY